MTLDTDNPKQALDIFSEYIAKFLAENTVINDPITSKVILHIQISDGIPLEQYLEKLIDKNISTEIKQILNNGKQNNSVSPVEIFNNRLRKIKL